MSVGLLLADAAASRAERGLETTVFGDVLVRVDVGGWYWCSCTGGKGDSCCWCFCSFCCGLAEGTGDSFALKGAEPELDAERSPAQITRWG